MKGYLIVSRVNYPPECYTDEIFKECISKLHKVKGLKYDGWAASTSKKYNKPAEQYFVWSDETDFSEIFKCGTGGINFKISWFKDK